MTVTYGFYNSVSGDRSYDAEQVGKLFDGLITDGVYASYGDALEVTPNSGLQISVGSGRAWFDHTWTLNDAALLLTHEDAEPVLDRIDAVVLEVDTDSAVRANSIKIIKGTPAASPVEVTMEDTATKHQYRLANVYIEAGETTLEAGDITKTVGTTETPHVSGIVDTANELQAQIDEMVWKFGMATLAILFTGDSYMRIPVPGPYQDSGDPYTIVDVEAFVAYAGTTNATVIQLNNGTNDILSTELNIDSGEYWSGDSATPAVIDTNYDSLSGVQFIDVDVDQISTTAPYYLTVIIYVARV